MNSKHLHDRAADGSIHGIEGGKHPLWIHFRLTVLRPVKVLPGCPAHQAATTSQPTVTHVHNSRKKEREGGGGVRCESCLASLCWTDISPDLPFADLIRPPPAGKSWTLPRTEKAISWPLPSTDYFHIYTYICHVLTSTKMGPRPNQ